jgi:hypothetical protein
MEYFLAWLFIVTISCIALDFRLTKKKREP